MKTEQIDAVVVGAGPGGYAAAIRLAQLGVRTLCVDRYGAGGVCLNVGCIPSKALISAAKTYEKLSHASELGIDFGSVSMDLSRMLAWKQGVVTKLTRGIRQLCKGNGVDLRQGTAHLTGPGCLRVQPADGAEAYEVRANSIIIATGSRPVEVPGFAFDGEVVVSSTGALSFSEVPDKLLVVGGGYIGLELGTVWAKLGSEVTVVEMTKQLLPGFDRDLVQVVGRKLRKRAVKAHLETRAASWRPRDGGGAIVQLEPKSGKNLEVEADRILVTVGRRPNTEELGLESLGVTMDGPFIAVDERLRTNVDGLYAIGDVVGQPMLAHKASKEADVVAEVITGHKSAVMDVRTIPAVVFTDPEIASAGASEMDLKASGQAYRSGKFPLAALGRALTNHDTDGFVKMICAEDSGDLLGVSIVGNGASDLISEAALAIEMGAHIDDLSLTVHPHPTLGEALMEAAKVVTGEAVHTLQRK